MNWNQLNKIILLFFMLAFSASMQAQLVGSFRITNFSGDSIIQGCSPLVVILVDSSKFNGSPVPYTSTATGGAFNSHTWAFGNPPFNNTSTQYRPSFVYSNPGTYTITLVVTPDGVNTRTVTKQVIVHPQPVVGFYGTPVSGCSPLTVTFYDTSANSTICTWSMGDGTVYTNQCTVTHTFNQLAGVSATCFPITLVATNQYGCQSSLTKNGYVCISPRPRAGFTVNQTAVCDSPFTVSFTDTSTATNGLSYFWRFDHPSNSATSTQQNPTHTYPPGTRSYTVSLVVRDTVCNTRDTVIKTAYISTSNVHVDFTASRNDFCAGQSVQFTANITGVYDSVLWEFGPTNARSKLLNPSYTYTTAGTWDVKLTAFAANGCQHDTVYTGLITVRPLPTAAFTYSPNPATSCQAPFDVNFTDLSVGAVSWYWLFQNPSNIYNSTQQNPLFTYNAPGTYSVALRVTNQYGCFSTVTSPSIIQIAPTVVNFGVDTPSGCAPLTVNFRDSSTSQANNPIIRWTWDFGDNTPTSNLRNPVHLYSAVGIYDACLTIVTQTGCVGKKCMKISVGNPPVASFIPSKFIVCVDEPISFINTSTGTITLTQWTFGFPGGASSSLNNPPPFAFDEPGTYVIRLAVSQNGCFDDTTITITVLPPKADFTFAVSCSNPGTVVFTDKSIGANTYLWNFNDPSSGNNTSSLPSPTHVFSASGRYNVSLTVTNTAAGCTHEIKKDVDISLLNVDFRPSSTIACAPATITFTNQSTGAGLTYLWDFGNPGPTNTSTLANPTHLYNNPGIYNVRLSITDINGCKATVVKRDTISNIQAKFITNSREGCIPSNGSSFPTFSFTDQSTSFATHPINSWTWNFGDGSPNSTVRNPTHQYLVPGVFTVSLTVTNTAGCSASSVVGQLIRVRKPIANFTSNFNLFCVGQPVQFTNQSTGLAGGGLTSSWNFGDPTTLLDTSTQNNPTYAYNDTGSFTVKLVVREGTLGCADSIVKPQLIRVDVPKLRFVANDTFRYCPPHVVNFTNFANFDTVQVKSVRWDFGDGFGFSSLRQPSYIYNRAGLFTVCLWVEFMNGCKDSICYPNYINVGGAVGKITAVPDTGCSPMTVCFNAHTDSSATNHIWFFGDNSPWQQGKDTICHHYSEAGLYQPAVLLIDTQVPSCQYVLTYEDTIIVDSVIAGFYFPKDTVCQSEPVQFTDSSKTLSHRPIVAWEWDFGDNTPIDTNQNPIHRFQVSGLIPVTLTAYSNCGCISSITRNIFVWERPTAAFDASDTTGCEQLTVIYTDQSTAGDTAIKRWFWNFGVDSISSDTSIVQNPPPYFYADTGVYLAWLLVVDYNGCRDTVYQEVNVYVNPTGVANPDTVQVCLNDTLRLLGVPGYATYDWSSGTYLSDSTIAQPWAVPLDTIDYELVTTDVHGCYTIDSIHVIVNPLPTLTLSPYPDTAICLGQTVQLNAIGNGIAFSWSPPDGLDDPTSATPLATPLQTTTYQAYTVDAKGCNITDTVRVVVNLFFNDYTIKRVCLGNRTDFLYTGTTSDLPVVSWQWDFGDVGNADVSSIRSPNYTYQDSGSYTVTLVVTDVLGCTDTLQKIARVDHPAEPQAFPDTIICYGDAIQLTAIGGDTIYWTPATNIDDEHSLRPIVSPLETTIYTAHITYGVCPFGTAQVEVRVNPTPQLDIDSLYSILKGDSVVLETTTGRYTSIVWQPATWLDCTTCASPQARPDTTISYTVTLTDSLGCVNVKTITVEVEERCTEDQIFVGNGFTPNGDGINDIAFARLHGLNKLIVYRIFDRWGDLIFETNNVFEGWDGKNSKGEQLNSGVYVYMVEAECFSGRKLIKTGNVAIIK
ncbi:hypothetical protein BH09BAC1_BH09BAC1_07020 [soil metagenome]